MQKLIERLMDTIVELNSELGGIRGIPEVDLVRERSGQALDAICLLETALVDAGIVDGAGSLEEAMGESQGKPVHLARDAESLHILAEVATTCSQVLLHDERLDDIEDGDLIPRVIH